MKILLVSSSARGHAIAEALSRSHHNPQLICLSPNKNPGLIALAHRHEAMDIMNFDAVLKIAKEEQPEFAFIGPDDPIAGGLADLLEEQGIPCIAPRKSLARIESSKAFARELMQKHGINSYPKFMAYQRADAKSMDRFIRGDCGGEFVVKYDALKGGKGVKVSGEHIHSVEEGIRYAEECIAECGKVVIEEKLIGVEFSLMSFASGTEVADMPAVQDHKRAYEGDTGPNTGGMGTYSCPDHSLPFLTPSDLEEAKKINRQIAAALLKECGHPYRGILYGGFIAVRDGVRVIEYNARFGDPEALNVLPILSSDFVELCQSMIEGTFNENFVRFAHQATVCKYITPKSYPDGKMEKGQEVIFPKSTETGRIYYGDISQEGSGKLLLGGSRSSGIVGMGSSLEEAEKIAQKMCSEVKGPVRFRADIGTEELVQQRVEMMKKLRS
ncbi:phosphoribosylamine--glycine ligase [Candidatus Peribacteria bacterium RIFCSPHIGHO2_01_FULL_55_13]|nr:MAG: phosphoribosylamine--glycine ligase [Candidatus Peribacteria bacterium RIFCSPHIGHO2_01_FULL_55_13]